MLPHKIQQPADFFVDEIVRRVVDRLLPQVDARLAQIATEWQGPAYLTEEQTARVLSVSKRTVQRMIATGEIPSRRIGGLTRVPKRELFADMQRSPK